MLGRTIFGVLSLVFVIMLVSVLNIQLVRAVETIYIKADGSIDPATVPISRTGDLYVFTGDIDRYPEGIIVQRSNIIIDGAGYKLSGLQRASGFYLHSLENVTFKNVLIDNFGTGICINKSASITVSESQVMNSTTSTGIMVESSASIRIDGCNMTGNNFRCNISFMGNSTNNYIVNNKIENGGGISVGGGNNIIRKNRIVNGGGIGESGWNNSISENILEHGGISASLGTMVFENTISGAEYGLYLGRACVVQRNSIQNCDYGIGIMFGSNNTLYGNYIANNRDSGISLVNSSYNQIVDNNIENNSYDIIYPDLGGAGVWFGLFECQYNELRGNNITNNEWGIDAYECLCSMNKIYHNNFVNNTRHGGLPGENIWDDYYPSGGNYWSGFSGVDEKSGPNQDQPGGDGIIDTQYEINARNRDRYPLFRPFISSTANDVYWLAKAIMSEASVGTLEEQIAVGWTVLNRLDRGGFGNSIEEIVKGGYAYDQEPTQAITSLAGDLLARSIEDNTLEATHFFSPRSMTVGQGPYPVPFASSNSFYPYWAEPMNGWNTLSESIRHYVTVNKELEWRHLEGIRNWYFMFYRSYLSLYDVNSDGKINIVDIASVAKAFPSKRGDAKWNGSVDFNNDEEINIVDLSMMAKEFGKTV